MEQEAVASSPQTWGVGSDLPRGGGEGKEGPALWPAMKYNCEKSEWMLLCFKLSCPACVAQWLSVDS
ncbi:hypothetical protein QTO34_012379 [Cnephaeus nilssonii]|uniref:Uncharacterized protein n=1 Tax=Cnephaeus nilssonii TaxID=3371016 RepID=A0AA40HBR7_CNENI|nr:hypothetical protein QTO34_012379 [Eptesicus nilssonii]